MTHYVGIDLGTTFSALAYIDESGRPAVVEISDYRDDNLLPSKVAMIKGDVIVGERARRHFAIAEDEAASTFKRDMGEDKIFCVSGADLSPTQLSAAVLKKLKDEFEDKIGPISEAVITIPANFSQEARDATMEAGRMAGLTVKYIINEPTAAALYYAHDAKAELSGYYAVFDLGGGTFDVSVIKVNGQDVEVVASNGIAKLGGDDFDTSLWKLISKKYKEETGKDLSIEDFPLNDAEDVKKTLSRRKRATVEIERDLVDVSRLEFEEQISTLIAQVEMMCENTIEEAGVDPSQITSVFLAGGSTRIPCVLDCVEKVFQQEPISTANVDEVVALGASVYAAYKSDGKALSAIQKKSINQLNLTEVTNEYFGTISIGESEARGAEVVNTILIHKGEKLPCSFTKSFFTMHDGQDAINCTITESKSPETNPKFVKVIHEEDLTLPPGRPAGQEVEVTFAYDENQMMLCTFKDVESGKQKEISISKAAANSTGSEIDRFLVE